MAPDTETSPSHASRYRLWPLYAAGFTTAFGAHNVAANLGHYTTGHHDSLLVLGGLLALYDGAEVILKPVFGSLSDRVGARPVLLGGLIAFAAASAQFARAHDTGLLWAARLGQSAAASAFSPPPPPSSHGSTRLRAGAVRSAPTASTRASATPPVR